MKKFSKIIVALVMFVTAFAFVGCGTPAWQQVDTVNTNCSTYEAKTYAEVAQIVEAEGEDELTAKSGLVKVSMRTVAQGMNMEIAGVLDTNDDATTLAALKCKMTITEKGITMTTDFVLYVTTDAFYVDGYIDMGSGLKTDLNHKISTTESSLAVKKIVSTLEGARDELEMYNNIDTIISMIGSLETMTDNFEFKIGTENDVTKIYIANTKPYTLYGTEYTKAITYLSIKDNTLQEFYTEQVGKMETKDEGTININGTICVKTFEGEMPTFDEGSFSTDLTRLGGLI